MFKRILHRHKCPETSTLHPASDNRKPAHHAHNDIASRVWDSASNFGPIYKQF